MEPATGDESPAAAERNGSVADQYLVGRSGRYWPITTDNAPNLMSAFKVLRKSEMAQIK
jgi:hypothetical protein